MNGIAATSIDDLQVLPLDPRIASIQEAYIRKVVDTLHDLPNVLWEVANESSGDGQVDKEFAELPRHGRAAGLGRLDPVAVLGDRRREATRGRARGYDAHPIGMTMQFPVADQTRVNEPLLESRAEWISPGYDDEKFKDGGHPMAPGSPPSRWFDDPPPADGAKVIITDTDHYAPGQGDALWAWKSFLRGHHPILMDFGLIGGFDAPDGEAAVAGSSPFAAFEAARYAMGDTRRYAEWMNLIAMEPSGELASTGYALVDPGSEYLVLEPTGDGEPFTVRLEPGSYDVEWFSVTARQTNSAEAVSVDQTGSIEFTAPFDAGPAVLYLRRSEARGTGAG